MHDESLQRWKLTIHTLHAQLWHASRCLKVSMVYIRRKVVFVGVQEINVISKDEHFWVVDEGWEIIDENQKQRRREEGSLRYFTTLPCVDARLLRKVLAFFFGTFVLKKHFLTSEHFTGNGAFSGHFSRKSGIFRAFLGKGGHFTFNFHWHVVVVVVTLYFNSNAGTDTWSESGSRCFLRLPDLDHGILHCTRLIRNRTGGTWQDRACTCTVQSSCKRTTRVRIPHNGPYSHTSFRVHLPLNIN